MITPAPPIAIVPAGPVMGRGFMVIDGFVALEDNPEALKVATDDWLRVPLAIDTGPSASPGIQPFTALTQK